MTRIKQRNKLHRKNIFTKPRFNQQWTHISELHQSQFSQLTDTVVGWAGLKEELHQTHLLTAEQWAHNLPAKYEGNNSPFLKKKKSAWQQAIIMIQGSQFRIKAWQEQWRIWVENQEHRGD